STPFFFYCAVRSLLAAYRSLPAKHERDRRAERTPSEARNQLSDIHVSSVDNFQARKFEIFSEIARHHYGYGLGEKSC
ncbi:MAG: hypothetical protein ACJ79K_08615, partial [Gemmatimonadaceae bacterium]